MPRVANTGRPGRTLPGVSFRIDTTQFDRAIQAYKAVSRREPADICNKKGLYIARGALRRTPAASRETITSVLGRVRRTKIHRRVWTVKAKHYKALRNASLGEVPMVALIINARRRRKGEKGLRGQELKDAAYALIAARQRSRGFLKSGWIPAIKTLNPRADDKGGAPALGAVKVIGKPKGYARPARREAWKASTIIANTASTDRDKKQALIKYGEPALQAAFNDEARSMMEEVQKRMQMMAEAQGIRTA